MDSLRQPRGNRGKFLRGAFVLVLAAFRVCYSTFLDERDRDEAEVEFIQKTYYNLLITWLLCLQIKKLIAKIEIFLFLEKL